MGVINHRSELLVLIKVSLSSSVGSSVGQVENDMHDERSVSCHLTSFTLLCLYFSFRNCVE